MTIVISISQLVISRQLGSPGERRDRIEATNDYREKIEGSVEEEVAPVTPFTLPSQELGRSTLLSDADE